MKIKLDENISRHLKDQLGVFHLNVTTVADEGLLSQSDRDIAIAANKEGRILITLDVEFANIRIYPPETHPGIILFRPRTFGPSGQLNDRGVHKKY